MSIVYCGDLWQGSTSRMRMEALERIGQQVIGVDTTHRSQRLKGLMYTAARKVGRVLDVVSANAALSAAVAESQPGVVWVDKGLSIEARTLAEISHGRPAPMLVSYSLDDMGRKTNQSRQYLEAIPIFDLHVTTKSYNVNELLAMGARDVLFVNNAYCPLTHRPQQVNSEDRARLGGPVGFIGAFERERAEAIWFLVTSGVPVRVWGEGWGRGWKKWEASHQHPGLMIEDGAVFGQEYAKAICSFDVNLAFLCKKNRDLQTTRSVEIPACGGLMLAERTAEHKQLFQ
jgi:spore maturation protein CgeB